MSLFQKKIASWLSRPHPERSVNQCFELPIVLGTDTGLKRSENQDRVGALRIGGNASGRRPLIAAAVVDGMGGMRDGGACATLALSSFFYALTLYRAYDLPRRAEASISHANDDVFRFAGGKGGATLSAVLVDHDLRPLAINIGDSRIYAFGGGRQVERLTRDDSLAEAFGGHGRELLQFVGMGEGMQPHIRSVPPGIQNLAVTTDGIHFVDASILEAILTHAVELRTASERLAALARWCGAPDNASSAMIGLQSLLELVRRDEDNAIQVWDPFGSLATIWIKDDTPSGVDRDVNAAAPDDPPDEQASMQNATPNPSRGRQTSRRGKRRKTPNLPKEDIQLEIKIESSSSSDKPDENSR